jgi:hypothetical protein
MADRLATHDRITAAMAQRDDFPRVTGDVRMSYWQEVISGAWDKTYLPLGWDRKKIALSLVSACGVTILGLHFGWDAMTASAIPLLWTISPIILAAVILFVWGIVETQAGLYAKLASDYRAEVAELKLA